MTPIERAAHALEAFDGVPCIEAKNGCPGGVACPANAKEAARAILQAIRKPSEAMHVAVVDEARRVGQPISTQHAWEAMIDAALAEGA